MTTRQGEVPDSTGFLSIPAITLRWVLGLRWWAVLGQTLTIAIAALAIGLRLPQTPLAAIIAITAISNIALHRWMRTPRSISPAVVASILAVDTLLLSALLYFTGGPSNPFSVLFLVQITLGALVLDIRYAAPIVLLSIAAYAALFLCNVPIEGMEPMHHHPSGKAFSLHLQGKFAAFSLAALVITYLVTKVSSALRERDARLADAQALAARNEKLASLGTLAAGAAHELGTPLATIAVAAKELEHLARAMPGAAPIRADARLIRRQVDRCRDIVQQMSAGAADTSGETPETVELATVAAEIRRRLGEPQARRLEVQLTGAFLVRVPWRGLVQAVGSLIKNADEASQTSGGKVLLAMDGGPPVARIIVADEGTGMAPADLARVGDPFFTTKAPGAGMGLGVFLAKAFADRLGGQLSFTSELGKGTKVVLELPSTET
jgi:two-component system sensor histidine kinase RegB